MTIETLNLAICKGCQAVHELKQLSGDEAAEIANCVKCGTSYTQFDPYPALNEPTAGSILDADFVRGR